VPETEYGGGKPPGGDKKGEGGDGDGNDDELKPMEADEKYTLTGIFAGYAYTKMITNEEYIAYK